MPMRVIVPVVACLAAACAREPSVTHPPTTEADMPEFLVSPIRETRHEGGDDLLSAGLGLAGLQGAAPVPADPQAPTALELRRLAVYSNWRGIGDLSERGGFGAFYGGTPDIPGREFAAFARVPETRHPHRVLVQVPDDFDRRRRCLIVAPASGSRGVYGAIALAGGFGLPRGCAIAYTDKGLGTDYFDFASDTGVALDGTRAPRGASLAFEPDASGAAEPLVAIKQAHSGDNPEADWGRHSIQAARFGLHVLSRAFPDAAPFTPANTIIVAAGVSNGGGAVLRALELDEEGLFDGALAAAPNVTVEGARPLYDVATEAALLQPCLLAAADARTLPAYGANPLLPAAALARCAALKTLGIVASAKPADAALEVRQKLLESGFTEAALQQAAVNVGFDLWRAVAVAYASSYLRRPADDMPCDFAFAAVDARAQPRVATQAERVLWWANTSGIAPAAQIGIVDRRMALPDPFLPGQRCLRALWAGQDDTAAALRDAVSATFARASLPDVPVLIVHGAADGLVPVAFTSRPYVEAARDNGRLAYWEIERVQHFDAFLGVTDLGREHLPLMAYAYAGLERLFAHLFDDGPPPENLAIDPPPRGDGLLTRDSLGMP